MRELSTMPTLKWSKTRATAWLEGPAGTLKEIGHLIEKERLEQLQHTKPRQGRSGGGWARGASRANMEGESEREK